MGAAKIGSGDPPAMRCRSYQMHTAKAGAAWGVSAPHVFYKNVNFFFIFPNSTQFLLQQREKSVIICNILYPDGGKHTNGTNERIDYMSASSKKKLRKEQAAAMLTEKQRQEQAEAKKLKAITVSFVAAMLVIVIVALGIFGVQAVNNSGVIDRNTVAAVIGDREIDSIQMNYYFVDYVKNMYSQWQSAYGDSASSYLSMMGLNINQPLDEQVYDTATGQTWAENLLEQALDRAKSDYALYDKAMAEGFALSEEEKTNLDYNIQMMELSAMYSGYASVNKYLRDYYGYGANIESYTEYAEISTIAAAYYTKNNDALSYTDAEIREYESDKYDNYSTFSYALYSLYSSYYLTDGTTDENGNTTYTDAQKDAALKAAEEAANSLATSGSITEMDEAIAALDINAENENAASTKNENKMFDSIPEALQEWLADESRSSDDIAVIPIETSSLDADGNEVKTTSGYYVVGFMSRDDNLRALANVRHLLVAYEGGTTDSSGNTTYTSEQKAAAKEEAEKLLQQWQDGNATEETFIELVKEHTDDTGSKETGGLYEGIHAGSSYVDSFKNWSLATNRKSGDTGIIASDYGYHIMYYVSDGDLTYRDYMITEDLRAEAMDEWHNAILETVTATLGKTNRLHLDLAIANIASA